MSGVHVVKVTYADGRAERIGCGCELCVAWRAFVPEFRRLLAEMEPEYRPEWLTRVADEGDAWSTTARPPWSDRLTGE